MNWIYFISGFAAALVVNWIVNKITHHISMMIYQSGIINEILKEKVNKDSFKKRLEDAISKSNTSE